MAKLVYSGITSLDGYIEDEKGSFDFLEPTEELHNFIKDYESTIGTSLYGRRLYEMMVYWETATEGPEYQREYGKVWRDTDKIVYSSTLTEVSSARTRIEPVFDPEAVRALKESADRDLSIGGPALAVHALRAGLVDEIRMWVAPVSLGGGKPLLPVGLRLELSLLEERRFANGTVHLRYRVS
ncbi:dihydrofolate reductase family protein [Actinoplanes sp. TFC3]|uniref:dihydrofolate reductase family protein n=1 Tax=Actinoplanes sp. TFC3 TaxID=1710355 RepID=UPI000836DF1C|nr:dihydrofolate reductase family protein [Actinoplanes sp. TFC3]